MSREQIEKMAKIFIDADDKRACYARACNKCEFFEVECEICKVCFGTKALYTAGYRKQSEGEWIAKDNINGRCSIAICSNCGTTKGLAVLLPIETVTRDFPYCEKCGAKMKGGAE